MTVYAITDTKKGRTGIAPTYLHTTHLTFTLPVLYLSFMSFCFSIYLLKFFIYVYSWTLFYTSFRFREIFVYCLTETVTSQPAKRKRRNEKSHSTTRSPAEQLPPTWSHDCSSYLSADAEFVPSHNTGPRSLPDSLQKDSGPSEYLNLFWTDDVWCMLVENTNRHAEYVREEQPSCYVAKKFEPVTVDEMKAFFGCRIAIECLVQKDRYEQYWRVKDSWLTQTPGFGKVFTRDRFLAIWSLMHCVDMRDCTVDKTDKIYKSRPVFDYLMEKFPLYYYPECELSLDEGMIPTKNALSFKQYIKDKPIRWGIKTFLLCESKTGYIVNASVYTGKSVSDTSFIEELGVTGSLVVRLSQPYHGLNYCLFTNRFYTSVTLAHYLLENCHTRICGTAMTNRKLFPKCLIRKKMDRGTSEIVFNGSVAVAVWCDKRPIYFVATKYIDSPEVSVLRYSAQEHKRVPVTCPKIAQAYNSFMGGTDRNDQVTKLCRIRRHYKWPRRLLVKFFMWAVYNAYIIHDYQVPHKRSGHRYVTFHSFVSLLCHELVGAFRRSATPVSRRPSNTVIDTRLINSGSSPQHLAERSASATSNQRCAVCSERYNRAKRQEPSATSSVLPKRTKTVYRCTACNVYLCVGSGKDNCFAKYHSVVEYWR